jgi:hypothetical protein
VDALEAGFETKDFGAVFLSVFATFGGFEADTLFAFWLEAFSGAVAFFGGGVFDFWVGVVPKSALILVRGEPLAGAFPIATGFLDFGVSAFLGTRFEAAVLSGDFRRMGILLSG